ncbi:MAG: leucyl/phenylalanyl-tRNA--protein transferase [Pseudomonadota bacterium]|nr:MAG: leucyl/phenylalanyl-tRNA--protein transferase [Pseudomonadota bacterium]
MLAINWLDPLDRDSFPEVSSALRDPDGLLAAGGDLSPERLLAAYRRGIFPWYSEGQPILWWSPDPRAVMFPENLRVSRSLRKTVRQRRFRVTFDTAFAQVVAACAGPRDSESGTWITAEMQAAYQRLHTRGKAHSVECWQGENLVGGLYGVALGRVFFGESMFSAVSDASKVAFVYLVRHLEAWGVPVIDCQVHTGHLASLGAQSIPRARFVALVHEFCGLTSLAARWEVDAEIEQRLEQTGGAT